MNRATAATLLISLAATLVATGCAAGGGTPATNATPQSTPAATTPSPSASTPSAPPAAAFRSSALTLSSSMRARMTGVSWHPGCPVGLDQLRLLRVGYWGFDGAAHQGELVVNSSAAPALSRAFGQLFAARFPIRQMRVVDDFGGDDERSMLADNTSAFNCRQVPGSAVWSQHAFGLAVDVNPFENPEVRDDAVDPPAAAAWADRTRASPAMISHGDAVWQAFDEIGWPWGGDWRSLKDYQHFSASGL
jgi:D-alanyl-D-alanine carboxypeptidase